MKVFAIILGLVATAVAMEEVSNCNYVTLVKCFINILDEWAWTLYELKDNVVTITKDQCENLYHLDKCIKDDLNEPHQCSHREVVEVSNTVSDLLTHRKDSGSFLRSYYLLTYACSPEGQEILTKHRECLKMEKIGEMTLSAGTYLSEKFLDVEAKDAYDRENKDTRDKRVCTEVNGRLQEYIKGMRNLCSKYEAAELMCQSLKNMFKGLHADKLDACELDCNISKEEADEENKVDSAEADAVQSEPEQLAPEAAGAALMSVFIAPLLAALLH